MAGGSVFKGLIDLRASIDANDAIGDPLNANIILEATEILFLDMHQAVFYDLAWQHEAYLTGGSESIEILRTYDQNAISQAQLDGWFDIASGNANLVEQANLNLLDREQRLILQPFWNQMILPSEGISFITFAVVPGSNSFIGYHTVVRNNPGADIDSFPERWDWILNNMWPAWINPGTAQRTDWADDPLGTHAVSIIP